MRRNQMEIVAQKEGNNLIEAQILDEVVGGVDFRLKKLMSLRRKRRGIRRY